MTPVYTQRWFQLAAAVLLVGGILYFRRMERTFADVV